MLQFEKWFWLLFFPDVQSKAPSLKRITLLTVLSPILICNGHGEQFITFLFVITFIPFKTGSLFHVSCIFLSKQAQSCQSFLRDHIFSDHICFYPLDWLWPLCTFPSMFKIRHNATAKSLPVWLLLANPANLQ